MAKIIYETIDVNKDEILDVEPEIIENMKRRLKRKGEEIFKLIETDHGFCRISYKCCNRHGDEIYYCFQDDGKICGGVHLYRSTECP